MDKRMTGDDVFISEVFVLPSGTSVDDPYWHVLRDHVLKVAWRGQRTDTGRGGYSVTGRDGDLHLSRAGKWATNVEPFQQRQYRWATLDEALAAARTVVDDVQIGGWTWRRWAEEYHSPEQDEQALHSER